MKRNKNFILVLVCLIVLGITTYKIIVTYAIFNSETMAKVQLEKGVWNIVVNGKQIEAGVNEEIIIDQINIDSKEGIETGKFAPGLCGNFDISINPENTNVSVRYDITLHNEEIKDTQFVIKSIKEVENDNMLVKTDINTYTGIIPLERITDGYTNRLKVEIEWLDDGTHDKEDTQIGSEYQKKLQIPITIHICQYLGEEIVEY